MTIRQFTLLVLAIVVVYVGGFAYDEIGPGAYALILLFIVSTPLLTKFAFWKKLLLFLPLIVLRVVGKVVLQLYSKSAFAMLLKRYGLLEKRYTESLKAFATFKNRLIERWRVTPRRSQGYLILIFLPFGIVVLLVVLVIKFFRLKLLQMLIEKVMAKSLINATSKLDVDAQISNQLSKVKKRIKALTGKVPMQSALRMMKSEKCPFLRYKFRAALQH